VKRTFIRTGLVLAMIVAFAMSIGCATQMPDSAKAKKPKWWYPHQVGTQFVMQYAKMPAPKGVLIVDARPGKAKYLKGFIPSAVNIPYKQWAKHAAKLPKDKSTLLIFYCQGPT